MNNMLLRALSGSLYVIIILLCIFLGSSAFWGLTMLLLILGMSELQRLLSSKSYMAVPVRIFDIITVLLVCSAFQCLLAVNSPFLIEIITIIAGFIILLYFPLRIIFAVADRSENSARSAMYSFFSIAYVAIPLIMLMICYNIAGMEIVLATFAFIWINDTGAYLSGMAFGRTKLCERLSPKKTWEGFWGGFVFCCIAGWLAAIIIESNPATFYIHWIVYAACVSVVSTFGDLFESLIKRKLGVKDSGNLIPGHGGILDRIDSLLAVAPIALAFAFIVMVFF